MPGWYSTPHLGLTVETHTLPAPCVSDEMKWGDRLAYKAALWRPQLALHDSGRLQAIEFLFSRGGISSLIIHDRHTMLVKTYKGRIDLSEDTRAGNGRAPVKRQSNRHAATREIWQSAGIESRQNTVEMKGARPRVRRCGKDGRVMAANPKSGHFPSTSSLPCPLVSSTSFPRFPS